MQVVMQHEKDRGCQVYDVHEKNFGYDITSLDVNSGELRLIEVKGIGEATGTVLLTPNERRLAEDRPVCRDVLATIHANYNKLHLSTDLIRSWHKQMYRFTGESGGEWKRKDNAILEVLPDGRRWCVSSRSRRWGRQNLWSALSLCSTTPWKRVRPIHFF